MNLLNSVWFFFAIIINIPMSLWLMTWMSPIASLFAGVNTLMYYTFQLLMFFFIFAIIFIVPTKVIFGSVSDSPLGRGKKK